MAKKKKIIVGNWKMNPPTIEEAKAIFKKIKRTDTNLKNVLTIICPSDVHLTTVAKVAGLKGVRVGVQDVFWEDTGFFTGQISPAMAYDAGARYAILGHSEKRKLGETNDQVAKKAQAVIRDKMVAIVCIGESERDKDGEYLAFLQDQILSSLKGVKKNDLLNHVIIAYEPIWEIGRQDMKAMDPTQIHEITLFIKKVLSDVYGRSIANEIPVLYGGSVSKDNAKNIIYESGVDGLLVGRQSLNPEAFKEILHSVNEKL